LATIKATLNSGGSLLATKYNGASDGGGSIVDNGKIADAFGVKFS